MNCSGNLPDGADLVLHVPYLMWTSACKIPMSDIRSDEVAPRTDADINVDVDVNAKRAAASEGE